MILNETCAMPVEMLVVQALWIGFMYKYNCIGKKNYKSNFKNLKGMKHPYI